MNRNDEVKVPATLMDRCQQFAGRMVNDYSAGRNQASLEVSSHGAERNVELQMEAKAAECAFAIWAGLDPINDVHWERRPDSGFDLAIDRYRIDVKHTYSHYKYLIWPVNKRHIFESKPFNALVLVKGENGRYCVSCWMLKSMFRLICREANEGDPLTPGTWYIHQADCWPMDLFTGKRLRSEAA